MTEKEISQRLFEYQKIIQTSLDGFWVVSVDDARILEVNEAFCRMVGYSRVELLSMSISDLEAVESPEELALHLKKVAESGYDRFETRHRHKLGHLIDLEVSVSYSGLDSRSHFAFARDITEHKRAEEALRASEREFRTMAENLPDNIVRYNRQAVTVYVNPVLERTLGDMAATMIGTTPREYHPDGSYEDYARLLDSVLASGEAGELEKIFSDPDGKICVHQIRVVPEFDARGEVLGALAIGRDITERKRQEDELRRREEEFRVLAENSPDVVVRYDCKLRRTYINPAWERANGIAIEAALGKRPSEVSVIVSGAVREFEDKLRKVLASGEPSEIEFGGKDSSGNMQYFAMRIAPEHGRDGKVASLLTVANNITEHKRAEEALRASERQFRALAENFPDTLIRYDREGHRTYVNPALERIFAVAGKQVIGVSPRDVNPLGLPEIYQHALMHTLATGESCEFEMQLPQRSGIVGTGFIKIAAERGADGQISGAISIGRDVTKLKQAEQQLRELAAHLQSVREEEKTRLAREIHDDLGSTLAALKLRLSHLMDFELPDNMKETALFARLESMSQILESAIASTRRIVTDMRPDVLDNLGLFAALKWQAERFNQHTGIACRIVCANDDNCADCKRCEFHLDGTLSINLFRIFQEALSNVARHSGASSVKAEYRPAVDHVFLSISDDGCGLPDGHVPASTSFGIRGMRERVVQLGGQIKFDSPGGSGLCVTVILPFTSVDTANVVGRS